MYQIQSAYDEDKVIVPTVESITSGNVSVPFRIQHNGDTPTHELDYHEHALDYPHSYPIKTWSLSNKFHDISTCPTKSRTGLFGVNTAISLDDDDEFWLVPLLAKTYCYLRVLCITPFFLRPCPESPRADARASYPGMRESSDARADEAEADPACYRYGS